MSASNESNPVSRWVNLDAIQLAPETDAYLTRGAEWYRISRERFADVCVERYLDEVLSPDPAFMGTVVRLYVEKLVADLPNAAEHFELR